MHFLGAQLNATGLSADEGAQSRSGNGTHDGGRPRAFGQFFLSFGFQADRLSGSFSALLFQSSLQGVGSETGSDTEGTAGDGTEDSTHERFQKIGVSKGGFLKVPHDPIVDVGRIVVPPAFDFRGASFVAVVVGFAGGAIVRGGVVAIAVHGRVLNVALDPNFVDAVGGLRVEAFDRPDGRTGNRTGCGAKHGIVACSLVSRTEIRFHHL